MRNREKAFKMCLYFRMKEFRSMKRFSKQMERASVPIQYSVADLISVSYTARS